MPRHPSERHLARADPRMAEAIRRCGPFALPRRPANIEALCGAIIGQQLSTTVAAAIRARFAAAFGTGTRFDAGRILAATHEELMAPGLSNAKARAVRAACEFWVEHRLTPSRLDRMEDVDILDLLTQIKGVGPWTVKMILIFRLGRPDVLPVEDLGLRAGLRALHGLPALPPRDWVEQVAEPWRPWRSVGTWYCWRWLHFEQERGRGRALRGVRPAGNGED